MAIYASLMTAIAGAIGLQLVKRYNAIPLGARTYFTAIERSFYDNPTIADAEMDSIPALSTLKIELAQTGKIIVALHTVYQDGISRLLRPGSKEINLTDVQPNMDVWIAPNGTVARLITVNTTQSTVFAPKQAKNDAAARQITEAKQRLWKSTVLEWICNIGLPVNSAEDEHWVEVEVSEPFYARLAAEHLRQMDDGQSFSPLKRILWPSKYCFRRTKATSSGLTNKSHDLANYGEDPLHFAESWIETASSRHDKPSDNSSNIQETSQGQDASTTKPRYPEKIESLARVVNYPDLQNASAVYPTPPDGALVTGTIQAVPDSLGADGPDVNSIHTSIGQTSIKHQGVIRKGSDDNAAFEHMDGPEVGSGLYDTNDDDELFGVMNDKDFGTKGITDDDFNFFDDDDDAMNDFMADKPDVELTQEDLKQASPTDAADAQMSEIEVNADQTSLKDETLEQPVKIYSPKNTNGPAKSEGEAKQPDTEAQVLAPKDATMHDLKETISTPLSPTEVKEMLYSNTDVKSARDIKRNFTPAISGRERKQSRYNAIAFKRGLTLSDQKYANAGRFFFTAKKEDTESASAVPGIPTIGIPGWRRSRPQPAVKEEAVDTRDIGSEQSLQQTASESSDELSFDSSDEYSENETSSVQLSGLKRKRPLSEAEKSTTSSMEKLSIASEVENHVSKEDTVIFIGNFFSVFTDWSLVGYFSAKQSHISPVSSRKEDQMQVAQLMVDQLTQSSLSHGIDGWESVADIEHEILSLHTFLEDTTIVGETERLDLKTYVTLHDTPQVVAETPLARPNSQRKEAKGSITKLAPAHLRIHRGRDFLEVLSTSMPFWETFGLEPASGKKNVSSYCICPRFANEEADAFLTRLALLYSSCNLGKHVRGEKLKSFVNGLGLWDIATGDGAYGQTIQSLRSLCEDLGKTFLLV